MQARVDDARRRRVQQADSWLGQPHVDVEDLTGRHATSDALTALGQGDSADEELGDAVGGQVCHPQTRATLAPDEVAS
jgi:hypothetical protein